MAMTIPTFDSSNEPKPLPGQRAGRVMLIIAWLLALALATWLFGNWQDGQRNPNQAPQSVHGDGFIEVRVWPAGRVGITCWMGRSIPSR